MNWPRTSGHETSCTTRPSIGEWVRLFVHIYVCVCVGGVNQCGCVECTTSVGV